MRRPNGFTLIEVMCAAVILALSVAAITSVVKNAQLREGDSRRRAQASLYADRLLADLDQTAALGAPLQPGAREVSEGAFSATLEVAAFDPTALQEANAGAEGAAADKRASVPSATGPDSAAAGGWLATPEAKANPPVFQVTVRVAWIEGTLESQVTRTSFFLNPVALQALEGDDAEDAEPPK